MPEPPDSALAEDLLLRLASGEPRAIADHCRALVACGLPLERLVDDGLAPALAAVGLLWQDGIWDVVDEHVATAQAEIAVATAVLEVERPPPRGSLVVACAEGEQHTLPARLVSEVLLADGWDVRFLGSSLRTADLVASVVRERPTAVLLSCTGVLQLPALGAALAELARHALPVLVGGAALGEDGTRAAKLGASAWAADATGARARLRERLAPALGPRRGTLEAHGRRVVAAGAWLVAAGAPQRDGDLQQVAEAALVALLLEEPALLAAQCDWYQRRHASLPAASLPLPRVVDELSRSVPTVLEDARRMLMTVGSAWGG